MWNFNIDEAPKGTTTTREIPNGKKLKKVSTFTPEYVFTASKCGKVLISRWIPEGKRWEFYTKDSPPIAWHPAPKYPNSEEQ